MIFRWANQLIEAEVAAGSMATPMRTSRNPGGLNDRTPLKSAAEPPQGPYRRRLEGDSGGFPQRGPVFLRDRDREGETGGRPFTAPSELGERAQREMRVDRGYRYALPLGFGILLG